MESNLRIGEIEFVGRNKDESFMTYKFEDNLPVTQSDNYFKYIIILLVLTIRAYFLSQFQKFPFGPFGPFGRLSKTKINLKLLDPHDRKRFRSFSNLISYIFLSRKSTMKDSSTDGKTEQIWLGNMKQKI